MKNNNERALYLQCDSGFFLALNKESHGFCQMGLIYI